MNDRDYMAATVQSARKFAWWWLAALVGGACWVLIALVVWAVIAAGRAML